MIKKKKHRHFEAEYHWQECHFQFSSVLCISVARSVDLSVGLKGWHKAFIMEGEREGKQQCMGEWMHYCGGHDGQEWFWKWAKSVLGGSAKLMHSRGYINRGYLAS